MWRPVHVVPEHKTRATLVWGTLLLAILGYIAWQIVTIADQYKHPSTSFSVSDDLYDFPPLLFCLWDGQGCDEKLGQNACVGTSSFTVYDSCNEKVSTDEEGGDIQIPSEYPNCLAFDLGQLNMDGFNDGCNVGDAFRKPYTTISISWIESLEAAEEDFLIESAGIFLGNGTTEEYSRVPYRRVVYSSETDTSTISFVNTYFTLGKNVRKFISGESLASYPILTLSTIDVLDQNRSTSSDSGSSSDSTSYAVGYAHLTFTQSSYSLTVLTDIDPRDIAALLGNIGGFWEILLVTWGLCFIATREDTPTEKGRDFTQPIQKGKEIVARKRRSLQPTVYSDSECYGEDERPHWEPLARARRQRAPGGSIRQIPSVNDGSVGGQSSVNGSSVGGTARLQNRASRHRINVAASFFRQPVPQDLPRRSFSISDRQSVNGEGSAASTSREAATTQPTNGPPSYVDCA